MHKQCGSAPANFTDSTVVAAVEASVEASELLVAAVEASELLVAPSRAPRSHWLSMIPLQRL